ncbi:MAG: acyl-CoA thioesterase [Sandaracinaceae bacterium]|nr:MAG: acyl-CoA thioesterase [Sandaracinaceae bacterium]
MSNWQETHQTVVHPWMCDHYGHMNVRFYAHLFDDASFVLWPKVGVTASVLERTNLHTVVARTETDFRRELVAGAVVRIVGRFDRVGTKSVAYTQELRDLSTDHVHAVQRAVEVFFDPETRESKPVPATIRKILEERGQGPNRGL